MTEKGGALYICQLILHLLANVQNNQRYTVQELVRYSSCELYFVKLPIHFVGCYWQNQVSTLVTNSKTLVLKVEYNECSDIRNMIRAAG